MDNADPELERRVKSVRDPVRRSSADGRHRLKLTYTKSNLGPFSEALTRDAQRVSHLTLERFTVMIGDYASVVANERVYGH